MVQISLFSPLVMLVNEAAVFLQLPPAARLSSSRLIFDGADGGMAAMMQKT